MNLAKDHSWSRSLAALCGSLPAALAWSLGLAHALPFERELRFAWGFFLFVPLWVAFLIGFFLPRSGRRAWMWAGALGAGGALLLLFP